MTLAQAYKKQFGKVSYPFELYDANGKLTYYEDSYGRIEGQRQSSSSNQTIEIDGVEYSAEQVRERIAELKPMSDK